MSKSKIEWTDRVWNPVTGCTKVSPGCANCYAERMAKRLRGRCGYPKDNPFEITEHPQRINDPLKWKKPSRIFVCSMGDLFHESVSMHMITEVFNQVIGNPQHTFIFLTKRPERVYGFSRGLMGFTWSRNFMIGVSIENQQTADERIPILLQIPAAVRFVSCEPLLGPVDLNKWFNSPFEGGRGMSWVICGGESGPGARPMHPDWARSLRDQCQAAGVPFFFKQWGEYVNPQNIKGMDYQRFKSYFPFGPKDGQIMLKVGKKAAGRLLDGKEWNEFPKS